MSCARRGGKAQNEIKTCAAPVRVPPWSTRASHPSAAQFSLLLHFLITKTLVSSNMSGEVTGFVSDFLSSGRQSVPGFGRAVLSLTACGLTYADHNICGQMVSVPSPPPPRSLSTTPAHSISGFPSSYRVASQRLDPKKLGAPSMSARECSRLLPTPKISRDSSNHPARYSSIMCTVVLPPIANHL